jgi:hypothetical protein
MQLIIGGKAQTCGAGDRCDVPAGTVHSAMMGPYVCGYIVGER